MAFRTLEELGYTEAQVKAFAAEYEVQDGPNADGEMFTRKAVPSDHFPSPFPNEEAAAAANNGAAPPDFSLIAKARGVERGFPQFVFDIFTQYQEGGPDYIHSLLTGYQEPPAGVEVAEGHALQPVLSMPLTSLAMPKPISDDQVTYDDGSPQTVDQYATRRFGLPDVGRRAASRRAQAHRLHGHDLPARSSPALVYLTKRSIYAGQGSLSGYPSIEEKAASGPPFLFAV